MDPNKDVNNDEPASSLPRETGKETTRFCCVPQCSTYRGPGIAFHSFPKEKGNRIAWKIALKMGKEITHHDRVCQEHFVSNDYLPQAVPTRRRYLKKNAVPTKILPVSTHDHAETSPVKRKKDARRKRAEVRSFHTSTASTGRLLSR